ncbi:MAG: hypothetical protein ACTSPB_15545 [Candidatus Thorarchaeota archaeon]
MKELNRKMNNLEYRFKQIKDESRLCGKWLLIGVAYGLFILSLFELYKAGAFEFLKNLPPPTSDDWYNILWLWFLLLG